MGKCGSPQRDGLKFAVASAERRPRVEVERGELAAPPLLDGQGRHRRVVGTQPQGRDEELGPLLPGHLFERRAQTAIGRHAAADGKLMFSLRHVWGVMEVDGISIRPVTDRQVDSLANFVEGPATP